MMRIIRPIVKKTSSRGSAMLAVLVFITLVLILGAGILSLADATVKQSRTLSLSDSVFYSAESALQVYVQLVEERMRDPITFSIIGDSHIVPYNKLNTHPEMENWRSDYLTFIKDQLKDIRDKIIPDNGGNLGITIDFDIGPVRLNLDTSVPNAGAELDLITDTRDKIRAELAWYRANDPDFVEPGGDMPTTVMFFPLQAITYRITATIGGRTLEAYISDASDEEDPDETESPHGPGNAIPDFNTVFNRPHGGSEGRDAVLSFGSYDGGAYFKNYNTNVYQALKKNTDGSYAMSGGKYQWETIAANDKLRAYNSLIAQLRYVISETDARTRDSVLGNIPATDSRWKAGTDKNATHIRVTGDYPLTGEYPNLEYLEVVGNLTISGTVNCPKLKGVYVGGSSGTAITISEGTQFSGNGSVGGTVFLTKGRDIVLYTSSNSDTLLLNGKFLASGGDVIIVVSGGGSGNHKSNSMFVATKNGIANKGKLTTTGQNFRMAAYSANQVPQYYAENDLLLHIQNNNASFEGIFATLTEKDIFDGTVSNGNLKGIFVGNCGKLNNNVRILPFNPTQVDKMLPGGLFDATGGEGFVYEEGVVAIPPTAGSLEINLNGVDYGGVARLVIRETTGDGDLSR